ncbi:MAG: PHP domain-containing protein [Clostridia bacterium]|nr:PHP domain-containing protein [Clostridia bacterium]
MIRSNPHTHTDYVDGKSSAREQVLKALSLGFTSLGFTEHACQDDFDPAYGLKSIHRQAYMDELAALKAEFAPQIKIYIGFEVDRLSSETGEGADYLLAANHYIGTVGGEFAEIDTEGIGPYAERACGGDWASVIRTYFSDYAGFVEKSKPDIIAHFDLIVKHNRTGHWFDEGADTFLRPGYEALERMIKACDVLEVNTGGMVRSNQPCPYPVMPFMKYWRELGGKVIPSSDCHLSKYLDAKFDAAEDWMREAGYKEYLTLSAGDGLFETHKL